MSVIGVTPGSPEALAPRSLQPVALYNANGLQAAPGVNADGSQNISGVDGATKATTANPVPTRGGALFAGTDRSGTANTASATLAVANAARTGLEIQNIGANNIGVNEFGGTAAIGTPGTYTLVPGGTMRVRTNRLITAIAATGATAYTATEY